MKYFVLLSLLLTGCGPQEPIAKFESKCGLKFMGEVETLNDVPGWTKETLQDVEDTTIREFSGAVKDARFTEYLICGRLKGFRIFVKPTSSWTDPWGRKVSGVTYCFERGMVVGLEQPYQSAIPHEIAHIVQGCEPIQPATEEQDADHANWIRDNIYPTIYRINNNYHVSK